MTDKAEIYRRQLGGTNAALRRSQQRVSELEHLCRDLLMLAVAGASSTCDRGRWYGELERVTERMEALGQMEVDDGRTAK